MENKPLAAEVTNATTYLETPKEQTQFDCISLFE